MEILILTKLERFSVKINNTSCDYDSFSMKYLATALGLIFSTLVFAQNGYEIKVTLKPFKNQYIYLGHYYGKQLPIIDSVKLNANSEGVHVSAMRRGGSDGSPERVVSPRRVRISGNDIEVGGPIVPLRSPGTGIVTGLATVGGGGGGDRSIQTAPNININGINGVPAETIDKIVAIGTKAMEGSEGKRESGEPI